MLSRCIDDYRSTHNLPEHNVSFPLFEVDGGVRFLLSLRMMLVNALGPPLSANGTRKITDKYILEDESPEYMLPLFISVSLLLLFVSSLSWFIISIDGNTRPLAQRYEDKPHKSNGAVENNINQDSASSNTVPKLRLIDCTYTFTPKPDYNEFREKLYGKFDILRKQPSSHKKEYLSEHIPGAVHFDMDVGQFPGKYERFSLYEPEMFEKYAQLLGINGDEHLILYGRGPFGGMLFPSRCFMVFKSYGQNKLSLVDGGFDHWKKQGFETESSKDYPDVPLGNFKAKDEIAKTFITFEEFNGDILDNPGLTNVFDTRIRPQFEGTQDTGLNPMYVSGTRIPNTINVPSLEFVEREKKVLKPLGQIKQELYKDYKPDKPTVTFCNAGIQASMSAIVQQEIFPDAQIRIYNGSLREMEIRAPERISEGPLHIN